MPDRFALRWGPTLLIVGTAEVLLAYLTLHPTAWQDATIEAM